MQHVSALVGIAVALAIGAASPGPSFVMIARTAAASGRVNGLSAAMGMGVGGFLFSALAMMGLTAFLLSVPTLYLLMKVVGGIYLAYLGIMIWRGAKTPLTSDVAVTRQSSNNIARFFRLGLATQLSNPKTAVVYAGVFATFLPAMPSLQFRLAVMMIVLAIETTWYALVALMLSSASSRQRYLQAKSFVDRLAGGIMFALGLKLAVSIHK